MAVRRAGRLLDEAKALLAGKHYREAKDTLAALDPKHPISPEAVEGRTLVVQVASSQAKDDGRAELGVGPGRFASRMGVSVGPRALGPRPLRRGAPDPRFLIVALPVARRHVGKQPTVFILHDLVAFADSLLEAGPVQDGYSAAVIMN
jgi:hypothetical protein